MEQEGQRGLRGPCHSLIVRPFSSVSLVLNFNIDSLGGGFVVVVYF